VTTVAGRAGSFRSSQAEKNTDFSLPNQPIRCPTPFPPHRLGRYRDRLATADLL
jgi:hypothetical protein